MQDFNNLKQQFFKDPQFKAAYDVLEPEYQLIASLIEQRLKRGLTQAQLAQKAATTQSAIARLEGGNANPSLKFLTTVAHAMDSKLRITFS